MKVTIIKTQATNTAAFAVTKRKEQDLKKDILLFRKTSLSLQSKISRSGAVVARWAHNPKVVRSSRASATKKDEKRKC